MHYILEQIIIFLICKEDIDSKKIIDEINNLNKDEQNKFVDFLIKNRIINIFFDFIDIKRLNFIDVLSNKVKKIIARYKLQNQLIIHEILNIQNYFHEAGIDIIFLKGIPIAFYEYDNFYHRPMHDIDILIDEEHIYTAYKVLKSKGYIFHDLNFNGHINKNSKLSNIDHSSIQRIIDRSHQLPPLIKNKISIEIHHRASLKSNFKVCPITNEIKKNKIKKNFYGKDIFLPNPDSLLIHQIAHFSLNNKFHFDCIAVFDIINIIEKNNLDIKSLVMNIHNEKLKKSVILTLAFIGTLNKKLNIDIDNIVNQHDKDEIINLVKIIKTKIIYFDDMKMDHMIYARISNGSMLQILKDKIFPSSEYIRHKYKYFNKSYIKIIYYYFYNFYYFLRYKTFDFISSILSSHKKKSIFRDFIKLDNWLN